jgi:hypothetical protein
LGAAEEVIVTYVQSCYAPDLIISYFNETLPQSEDPDLFYVLFSASESEVGKMQGKDRITVGYDFDKKEVYEVMKRIIGYFV